MQVVLLYCGIVQMLMYSACIHSLVFVLYFVLTFKSIFVRIVIQHCILSIC